MKFTVSILSAALCGIVPGPARAVEKTAYAVIVGNNQSMDVGVDPLRYADDDAARFFELLSLSTEQTHLLTVMDAETQRLHRSLVAQAQPPTWDALQAALTQVNQAMRADKAQGREPTLYFVFIGHGNVDANKEGYVSLLDRRLTRAMLFHQVIAPSEAAYVHLIIDACDSYFLVNSRGGLHQEESHAEAISDYLAAESVERYPGLGVVLSTSRQQESHEWSGFGAGIFSHEVRSALAGAADANGDGQIEYSELHAFVAAANLSVDDPRAKLEVFVRPPARDQSRALLDLTARNRAAFLYLPASLAGRFYLEDDRGVRFADFNKAGERPLVLGLPRVSTKYFLRSGSVETTVPLAQSGLMDASTLAWQQQAVASRGALQAAFAKKLFSTPYGESFYRGFVAQSGDIPVSAPVLSSLTE